MSAASAYANRRSAARKLFPPRNARAAGRCRNETGKIVAPLVVSFVGDVELETMRGLPTVYCDSGAEHDWACVAGLHAILLTKPGVDARHAMREILARTDCLDPGYPTLVDVEQQEVACIIHGVGKAVALWQVRRGTDLWHMHFGQLATP